MEICLYITQRHLRTDTKHTVLQERNIPLLHVGFQLTQSKQFREPSPCFNITAIIGKESDVGGNLSVVKTYQSLKS